MPKMNKNISDYKWVMLWAGNVCSNLRGLGKTEPHARAASLA